MKKEKGKQMNKLNQAKHIEKLLMSVDKDDVAAMDDPKTIKNLRLVSITGHHHSYRPGGEPEQTLQVFCDGKWFHVCGVREIREVKDV